jgi:hypothetical protein
MSAGHRVFIMRSWLCRAARTLETGVLPMEVETFVVAIAVLVLVRGLVV